MRRHLLAFLACIAMAAGPALAAAAPSTLTPASVTVSEGDSEKTVELQQIDPVKLLTEQRESLSEMNRRIVDLLLTYPRDGRHDYWWPRKGEGSYDGGTTDVVVGGITVMRGEKKGRTFCCGLTLEVCYRVLSDQTAFTSQLSPAIADKFKKAWFCYKINSPGPNDALVPTGLGRRIEKPEEARPGDFVQLWRHNKSGHSVIFIAWALDKTGKIAGLHYWSTQPGTDGINFNTELFGKGGKAMMAENTVVTRLLDPQEWKKPGQ